MLEELTSDHEVLVAEHVALKDRVRELEAELARYRQQERLVTNALVAAKQAADGVRREARHDAELTLRKARKHAERLARSASARRERLEEETARLIELNEATRERLSAFLLETLSRVQPAERERPAPLDAGEEYAAAEPI
jgi:cell division septum initiation protein DivIVA